MTFTNSLSDFFFSNKGNLINKWHHYFEIYERHFEKYKGKDVALMEIGVYHGGSLQMWKNYFGKNSRIYGIDINPECKKFEDDNVKIFIGSQEDRSFLRDVLKQIPELDIIIDDGGHTMRQQIVSFEVLYDRIKEDGIYLCEDTHTSYWKKYGGGYKRRGSFIEYSKQLIDFLYSLYPLKGSPPVNNFSKTTHSMHFYPGILVIEKRKMETPVDSMTGTRTINDFDEKKLNFFERLFGQRS